METALKILLASVALICIFGGINLLVKGAASFLPKDLPSQKIIDNLFRFLAGIYFSAGFLMTFVLFNTSYFKNIIYFLALMVIFSGLGRLYSKYKVGSAGKYFDIMMWVEIGLGITISLLNYLN
ncbi:MAG TPA: DUF4345 domain-containing protein [Edaphocola sp.]|nr:DUF4345 domain-containing protein [Edaphocola sp.]